MNLDQLITDGQNLTNENTSDAITQRLIHLIKTECPYETILGHKVYFFPAINAIVPVAAVVPLPDFVFISMNTECKLPVNIKEAIIAHEIGHLVLSHASDMSVAEKIMHERFECVRNGQVHQSELDADAYAASIVGVDNHELADFFGITTINQNVVGQGELMAKTMLELLDNPDQKVPDVTEWPIELIVRSSTARAASQA
jgi:hypothetical protein